MRARIDVDLQKRDDPREFDLQARPLKGTLVQTKFEAASHRRNASVILTVRMYVCVYVCALVKERQTVAVRSRLISASCSPLIMLFTDKLNVPFLPFSVGLIKLKVGRKLKCGMSEIFNLRFIRAGISPRSDYGDCGFSAAMIDGRTLRARSR